MNNLEQITAKRNFCDTIMKLGVTPSAFLWWVIDIEKSIDAEDGKKFYEVAVVDNPQPSEDCLPAWTKAEIDVLIGPDFTPKPDLFTKQQLGNYKLAKPESYPIYFPDKMIYTENGADASAQAFIYLTEGGHIKVKDANARLQKVFRPFKK